MANIQRIPVALTIPGGGAGVSVFYAADTDTTAVAALSTFWGAVANLHPATFAWFVPGSGDKIDETNGHIAGSWSQSGSSSGNSAAGLGSYAAGVGMRIRWQTDGIVHNRRVRGSTFLCPLNAASYQDNGTIITATLTTVTAAAVALVAASNLLIWSPPVTAEEATPTVPERSGSSHVVTGTLPLDRVAVLRSRRV